MVDSATENTKPTRYFGQWQPFASWLGWCLLILWCAWWVGNLINGRMLFVEYAWFKPPAFGVDFMSGVYRPTVTWLENGDPYQSKFNYPPIVTRLYMWVALFSAQTSLRIWVCTAAGFAAFGALAAIRSRAKLGLEAFPISLGVASILFSTSVLFGLERGNCDLIVVPCIVGGVALMQNDKATGDVVAGALLAIAASVKIYPGLLIIALIALRRPRVAFWMGIWCLLAVVADVPEYLRFIRNISIDIASTNALARSVHEIHPWNHTFVLEWRELWAGTPLSYFPGHLGTFLVIGSLFAWVSWQVYRTPYSTRISLPYCYWTVAAATFTPAISNDYNLTPLPLAILALYSRGYSWAIYLGLLALGAWWEPVALPVSGRTIYFAKLVGLITVAAMLSTQAKRLQLRRHVVSHGGSALLDDEKSLIRLRV